jgi:hypothetical protein
MKVAVVKSTGLKTLSYKVGVEGSCARRPSLLWQLLGIGGCRSEYCWGNWEGVRAREKTWSHCARNSFAGGWR